MGGAGVCRVIAVAVGVSAAFVVATPAAAEPVEELRVSYTASETEGSVAVDSSTFGNHGRMKGGVTRRNGVYRFHPLTVGRGEYDRIVAPSDPSFNPGDSPFSYGARVKVRPDATWSHRGMALLRHGDSDTPGGDYKLELKKLKSGTVEAFCEMRDGDGDGRGYIQGDGNLETIADGLWHTITCARVDVDTVSLTVDGITRTRDTVGDMGRIRSKDPFMIGCQPFAKRPDLRFRAQLHGAIDDIHVTVQEEVPPETS
jgi:hypothetical protein